MRKQRLDLEKALEVLLYITASVKDTYKALKILYFADKEHLNRYGRLICGESYIAMKDGPVPSGAYDLVKFARGVTYFNMPSGTRDALQIEGYDIFPQRKPDLEFLSESDIECLNVSINKFKSLSFSQLRDISHQEACYKKADRDDEIEFENIVESLPDGHALLDYLDCE